jgi:hypothetical protein
LYVINRRHRGFATGHFIAGVVFLLFALGVWGLSTYDNGSDARWARQQAEAKQQAQLSESLWRSRNRLAFKVIQRELREGDFDSRGCPKYFLRASDWQALSFQAVRENLQRIQLAHRNPTPENLQWVLIAVDPNWHNNGMVCAHTGMPIISYAELDEIPS